MPNAGGGFTRTDASRQLGFTATGTIYGSYLVDLAATTHNNQDITSDYRGRRDHLRRERPVHDAVASMQMELNADSFGTEPSSGGIGAGRIHGSLGSGNFSDGGTVLSEGTTYLVIFKMTGLGASAQTQTLTEWVLTAAQFNNFAPFGLDESELNAATLGAASTNVQERGTTSTTDNAQLLSTYYMHLFGALGSNATIDELRVSNASIGEAVEAPEPASLGLLAAGEVDAAQQPGKRPLTESRGNIKPAPVAAVLRCMEAEDRATSASIPTPAVGRCPPYELKTLTQPSPKGKGGKSLTIS